MKKIYSFVLMATALLFSANVKALDVTTFEELDNACRTAPDGAVLEFVLQNDITANKFIPALWGEQVTIDLNGHNITSTVTGSAGILRVKNGSLTLVNSSATASTISGSAWGASIYGSATDVANYSVLKIGKNVNLTTTNDYGIVLSQASGTHGYGIVVEVNGRVQAAKHGMWVLGNIQDKEGNIPQVTVGATGELIGGNGPEEMAGLAGMGYGKYTIEGTVSGAVGIYAKAGIYDIKGNATITATATSHAEINPNSNGFSGGMGSAIVSDTKAGYAGGMEITISGNPTITTMAADGYAIEEIVSQGNGSKTESLVISGGTFNGNIKTTAELKENIVVNGTITGGTFDTDVTEYLNKITGVITPTQDENGKTIYAVADKPAAAGEWINNINSAVATSYVRLNGNGEQTLSGDIEAKYLVMQGANDKVIVPAGKTLKVGEIVMGPNAVIEVAAGGKLIVTDENGFVSNQASNLVLQAQESSRAIFVLNPDVVANKHPKATVEFFSKSFVDGDNYASQRFGIPANGALESIDAVDPADASVKVGAKFYEFDYANNVWAVIGGINGKTPSLDLSKMANPFDYYQMYNYVATPGTKVIMKGNLVGNDDPQLNVRANFWNGYANSFMGLLNINQLLSMIPETVDKAIYLYDLTTNQATWEPVTNLDLEDDKDILPMQPFLIRNTKAAAAIDVDYAAAVYAPTLAKANAAPARRGAASDITKAKLVVKGENCIDRVTVAEDARFSASFDNGYDAAKYMNDGINMYVMADEKMAVYATDNINDTYLGFQTVKGGNYTIEFSNVRGNELTLVDLETGVRTAMIEGNVYEFTADADITNDYRFQIVSSRKVPTAIENTEAAKNAKGIYTITGQYMGDVNVWNTLPAGVYVVNGAKRVK